MKYVLIVLFFITALCKVTGPAPWAVRQTFGLLLAGILVSYMLSKRFHSSVGICAFLILFFGVIQHSDPIFNASTNYSLFTLAILSCLALGLEVKYLDFFLPVLGVIAVSDSLIMIIHGLQAYIEGGYGPFWYMQTYWVMSNASLDACFLALMAPVVFRFNKLLVIPLVIAILMSRSNTGVLAMLLTMGCYQAFKKRESIYFGLICLVTGITIYLFFGTKLLSNFGRFHIWDLMMTWWWNGANHIIGTGPGTFWIDAKIVQTAADPKAVIFPWMHNDWLQCLFEGGILLEIAVIYMFAMMLYRSYKKPVIFSMVLGYGFISITQFPLHLFFFQILGIGLLSHCFIEPKLNHGPA